MIKSCLVIWFYFVDHALSTNRCLLENRFLRWKSVFWSCLYAFWWYLGKRSCLYDMVSNEKRVGVSSCRSNIMKLCLWTWNSSLIALWLGHEPIPVGAATTNLWCFETTIRCKFCVWYCKVGRRNCAVSLSIFTITIHDQGGVSRKMKLV